MGCNLKVTNVQPCHWMIRKHYDLRKIQGEKCKPIYKAIAFPVLPAISYLFQSALEPLGVGSHIEICWLDFEEQGYGKHVREYCLTCRKVTIFRYLIKGNEQGARILKIHFSVKGFGYAAGQTVTPDTQSHQKCSDPANLPDTPHDQDVPCIW